MRRIVIVAIASALSAAALQSQSASERVTAEMLDATIRYLHDSNVLIGADRPKVTLKFDPTIFVNNGSVPSIDPAGPRHSEHVLGRVQAFAGAAVVTPARARECQAYAPADCMTNGASLVIRLAVPVIQGDSGYVDLYSRGSSAVSAEDSVKIASTASGRLEMNLRRAGQSVRRALLAKTPGGWVVTKVVTLRRS